MRSPPGCSIFAVVPCLELVAESSQGRKVVSVLNYKAAHPFCEDGGRGERTRKEFRN